MRIMVLGARSAGAGGFRARLRDPDGRWAVLEASPLIGADEEQTAIAIEPVTGDQVLGLMLTAYGLTARERDICHQVIGGHSTAQIAEHLFISTNTVQDHLKSVFAKVGVRSRGELVARLRPEVLPAGR
jgi:DNA-binding CsgD family transcriptional regulator